MGFGFRDFEVRVVEYKVFALQGLGCGTELRARDVGGLSENERLALRVQVLIQYILVAEWLHFTLLGIILPTIKLKVYTFRGLMNSATKIVYPNLHLHNYYPQTEYLIVGSFGPLYFL